MIFYILILIVFIAELIITAAILINLFKMNKMFQEYSTFLNDIKPKLKDLMQMCTKISEQLVELAPIFVEKIKSVFANMIIGQLKNALAGLTFWLVKKEVEKHAK